MSGSIGRPVSRVDGPAKVTGAARYAAEFAPVDVLHVALVGSTVPKGRIAALDTRAAQKAAGVRAVITHLNAPRLPYRPFDERPEVDPSVGEPLRVFQGPEVRFSGQPIAAVVADTLAQARHAAALVGVTYAAQAATTTFEGGRRRAPKAGGGETRRGAAVQALGNAAVTVDAVYVHPREHHNAMEPHATVALWEGERLTLWDKTQWVNNDAVEIAHVFGLPDDHVRVICPYVGGAFGSGLRTWPHVTIAALAARLVGRPVRVELTRRELYTSVGFRPHTEQRVALGARRDGRLTALIHEATAQTSAYEEHTEETLSPARVTYACPNVLTRARVVELDTNTPTHMRAPGAASGLFALECAMDELAVALDMDPLELRLANYAELDKINRTAMDTLMDITARVVSLSNVTRVQLLLFSFMRSGGGGGGGEPLLETDLDTYTGTIRPFGGPGGSGFERGTIFRYRLAAIDESGNTAVTATSTFTIR